MDKLIRSLHMHQQCHKKLLAIWRVTKAGRKWWWQALYDQTPIVEFPNTYKLKDGSTLDIEHTYLPCLFPGPCIFKTYTVVAPMIALESSKKICFILGCSYLSPCLFCHFVEVENLLQSSAGSLQSKRNNEFPACQESRATWEVKSPSKTGHGGKCSALKAKRMRVFLRKIMYISFWQSLDGPGQENYMARSYLSLYIPAELL